MEARIPDSRRVRPKARERYCPPLSECQRERANSNTIDPGKPWQNGYGESFHARLRDECLSCEEFWSVAHARVVLEGWRHEYNTEHLHSSLGYATPAEFAATHKLTPVLVPA